MPNPHYDMKIISRGGKGRSKAKAAASAAYNAGSKITFTPSVVSSAAYRSGEALYDKQRQKTYDYSHKDEVVYTTTMTPPGAPVWASDRQFLWNMVEKVEKRKDAQLARDIIAALPRELNHEQQIALVRDYVEAKFVALGMVADIAIHDKLASDGKPQPHAHIMLTMREISADGFAAKKNRAWNKKTRFKQWRKAWEDTTNDHLEKAERIERLDLRSYAEQGIEKIPGEHMGPDAWNLEEQHGVETRIGDHNRDVRQTNAVQDVARNYAGPEDVQLDAVSGLDAGLPTAGLPTASLVTSSRMEKQESNNGGWAKAKAALTSFLGAIAAEDMDTLSDAQLDAIQQAHIRLTLASRTQRSIRTVAEGINRLRTYGRIVMEKTGELAQSVFDRYAVTAMKKHHKQQEREIQR